MLGIYFLPVEGYMKDVYGKGLMTGAELNIGVWNNLELWLAQKYFARKEKENNLEEERKFTLIPLEAGVKFRFNKGIINPYVGGGFGYYQFKEELPDNEVREKKMGFIGQAGCFVKIGGYLTLDLFANYRSCKISSDSLPEFNFGGLNLGIGLGFEY
jgi:hypothetical protein